MVYQRTAEELKRASASDEMLMNRVADQLGHGMQAKLVHEAPAVRFHGADADGHVAGDLLIRFAGCQINNNLPFSAREGVRPFSGRNHR